MTPQVFEQIDVGSVSLSDMTASLSTTESFDDTPNKGAKDKSLMETGLKMIRAQETRNLMQLLLRQNLTTNATKNYDKSITKELKSNLNIVREGLSLNKAAMMIKLKDAKREVRTTTNNFKKAKRMKLKDTSKEAKEEIKKVEKKMAKERKEIVKKHNEKVKNIRKKKAEDSKEDTDEEDIPDEAKEFKDLEIYKKIKTAKAEELNAKNVDFSDTDITQIGVNLSDEEIKALKLPPKFCLLGNLNEEDFELELERMNTKLRYDAKGKSKECLEEEKEPKDEETKKVEELSEEIEVEARQVFDPDSNTIDFRKRRPRLIPETIPT